MRPRRWCKKSVIKLIGNPNKIKCSLKLPSNYPYSIARAIHLINGMISQGGSMRSQTNVFFGLANSVENDG
jgi:hypothetical protein